MSASRWPFTVAVLAGLIAGAGLAVARGGAALDDDVLQEQSPPAPVVLNTAVPAPPEHALLANPVSLEGAFGRGELTGESVASVPQDPLQELELDRRWDVALALAVPRPSGDLPPARAADERQEPRADAALLQREPDFSRLPPEARAGAANGLRELRQGYELLRDGDRLYREAGEAGQQGRLKIRQAAERFRGAINLLETALRFAPGDRELLILLREAKAGLYHCMKHGM
jgi:hypothetical protein